MKRIWHDYRKWEDFKNGMYNEVKDELKTNRVSDSIALLKDEYILEIIMREVITNWFYASEQFLTHKASNRQAWLGQAACNYAHKATESETRQAWNQLTTEEMKKANDIADIVIKEWECKHEKRIGNKHV